MATDQITQAEPVSPLRRHLLRWSWRVFRMLLVLYLVLLLVLASQEQRLVYPRFDRPEDDWHPDYLDFEDVTFAAADGTQLHGWYLPHEDPRAVVLMAHGNAGNLSHRADKLRRMHGLRLAIFAFDYRGYGKSEGEPSEAGLYQDARAARKWLAEREQIVENQIVLFGTSLGGAVLIDLAAGEGARGLVLESTFDSLPNTAAAHYPFVPVGLLMRNRFNSLGKIARYHGPLLQYHGKRDRVVPYENARRLYAQANPPKEFVTAINGTHAKRRDPAYEEALEAFFDRLPTLAISP